MKFLGAHVSASGGIENAPLNAHAIGAKAFALFTRNQRQWKSSPLTKKSISLFKERCEEFGYEAKHIPIRKGCKSRVMLFWMRCNVANSWNWIA